MVKSATLYRVFKYSIYCLLAYNVFLFFQDDYLAAAEVFRGGVTWRNVVEAYSATIDTLFWVVLLLLFELETAVIPDEKLRGNLKWVLSAIRAVCYFFITYAFYGYCVKYGLLSNFEPYPIRDICDVIGSGFTYIADLDEYPPIDATSCQSLRGETLYRITGTQIIGSAAALDAATKLSIVDIVNAGDWLLVVAFLEVEVFLQINQRLTNRMVATNTYIKAVLYGLLLVCAVYWGINGDFLDFWDAFLWLVAFVFIELNIFEWHAETTTSSAAERTA